MNPGFLTLKNRAFPHGCRCLYNDIVQEKWLWALPAETVLVMSPGHLTGELRRAGAVGLEKASSTMWANKPKAGLNGNVQRM